jgi:hypothetical protein
MDQQCKWIFEEINKTSEKKAPLGPFFVNTYVK